MAKERESIVTNTELRDSSSKLIFGDNILCSQFLRDYGDMDILRHIQPEDLEDVSDRYVPLYSAERESDTVKKVDISRYLDLKEGENSHDLPLFIVSLVEHKTKVEYNVAMQILRYAIHIWEDYEREISQKSPRVSALKDFRYPPILPIVYFEGKGNWTAPRDVSDRIFCGELLGEYLPHFRYQLVRLHDYSNETLLAKKDEISVAMLINKIQSPEDITSFENLPGTELDRILADTPEHLLELLAKSLRALLYSMNVPEEETEDVVARIKERKMGRLFENQTIDIQAIRAERKAIQEQHLALQAERQNMEAAMEIERQNIEAERRNMEAAQRELEIYKNINQLARQGNSPDEIRETIIRDFMLTEKEIREIFEQ